ncbi:MAG: cysteine--1-D-myo-inosityl 2-amino-2-deoxy-alpha-D-glucopyranoside ligase [Actinobacteria bacterium]|jgi:L-cysteine:1D-myo-inositol 2-amino-2-deoxy-alpha-D-glucopyranoside ligase|nr:cysteine--1-D-myo-inosityl 2-amino-2-deoxy-alpha-D-glucopyranoside ligase [Actinomycetota bacterium]NDA40446.1 cysteine--1-D-myo-inosityl 2-amino-2-deoxy-alpha-D-glucopyranoside ligase [Actinomycetota bacterium]
MRSWPSVYLPPSDNSAEHPFLRLTNSYTSKMQELKDAHVASYVCGITPYDATHLGHAATYLTFDLIHRFIIASGKSLHYTQNITDIDEPLLERAKRDNQNWEELATSQIELFREDMTELRILPPNNYLGVVESMSTVISYIKSLMDTGKTYELQGDIYLDIKAVQDALENLPIALGEALTIFASRGGDPDRAGKRHPLDTLIWSSKRPGEPSWSSSFGTGRPGWHIECVAIALSTLTGQTWSDPKSVTSISLQGGGSDLRFPHHYMTNVQARAITGKSFANIYLHTGMIAWQGEKMSKSLGNLVFVSKLREAGWGGNEIRLALINRDYRADLNWEMRLLDDARSTLVRIHSALSREEVAPTHEVVLKIRESLADNLDVKGAISAIIDWCEQTELGITGGSAGQLSRALDLYLGIAL